MWYINLYLICVIKSISSKEYFDSVYKSTNIFLLAKGGHRWWNRILWSRGTASNFNGKGKDEMFYVCYNKLKTNLR